MKPGVDPTPRGPSSFYSSRLWSWGHRVARWLPAPLLHPIARGAGRVYAWVRPERRRVVVANLLPLVEGNLQRATEMAGKNFAEFASKLLDLWRYEAGFPMKGMFGQLTGWDGFVEAHRRGRGVLLVTPHLGNWEFGAPLLQERGVRLMVLTQPEPDPRLTQLREEARRRWGIQTVVVGNDPFAFVSIIQQLNEGAVVALLLDRPPAATAVEVEFFGRPFAASVAAAELARASGCAILPVYLPRVNGRYEAHLLPEITYDRAALGNRDARIRFTGEILRAFEPALRQHPDQWFHFVPLWNSQPAP